LVFHAVIGGLSILQKIADLIDRDLEKLVRAESVDNGKAFETGQALDIPRASANIRFFATAVLHSNQNHI